MRTIIINPNSTVSMTDAMVEVAKNAVPQIDFVGWTSSMGPASIQGEEDGRVATPPLLDMVRRANDANADCIIIGCFDDTALEEAAEIANCPVIGIGQASYLYAALRHWRFSVVTTLSVSVPVLQENIRRIGLTQFLGQVRASDVAVLDLERDPEGAERKILAEAQCAFAEDGIDALVLGCAGMVHVTEAVREALSISVLDPVETAAACARWIAESRS